MNLHHKSTTLPLAPSRRYHFFIIKMDALVWLFDLRRAPLGFSLTIGVFAGCSAIVLGGGSCPGFGIRRRRVSLA
jgi:hypothetical protein